MAKQRPERRPAVGKEVYSRTFTSGGHTALNETQPRRSARYIAAALAGANQAARDLIDHRRISAVPTKDHRERFVKTRHAISDAAHRNQGQSGVAQRLALEIPILKTVSNIQSRTGVILQVVNIFDVSPKQPKEHI